MRYTDHLFNRNDESDSHAGFAQVTDTHDFIEDMVDFVGRGNGQHDFLFGSGLIDRTPPLLMATTVQSVSPRILELSSAGEIQLSKHAFRSRVNVDRG